MKKSLMLRPLWLAMLLCLSSVSYAQSWVCTTDADLDGDPYGPILWVISNTCTIGNWLTCSVGVQNSCISNGGTTNSGPEDNCPTVVNANQLNTDGDAQGDACDTDDDNDGVMDISDNCPLNANPSQANFDGDSQADACDADDDNDNVVDAYDQYPFDDTQAGDYDADGIEGLVDNCPASSNADQLNTDGDAQGNACDTDDDNDSVADTSDKFPLNVAASSDFDVDGYPGSWNAACDATCQANSGLTLDNCSNTANPTQANFDGDSQGDACDSDDDNDGVADSIDAFDFDPTESADTDNDGVGNNADWDDDNDGVPDTVDAEPLNAANSSEITLPLDGNYKGRLINRESVRQ